MGILVKTPRPELKVDVALDSSDYLTSLAGNSVRSLPDTAVSLQQLRMCFAELSEVNAPRFLLTLHDEPYVAA